MKLFDIRYKGLWLGGKSLVFAENEEQALSLVREDPTTVEFENVTMEKYKE